jgi:hypothetical protein
MEKQAVVVVEGIPPRSGPRVSSRSRIGIMVATILATLWLVWPHFEVPVSPQRSQLSVVDKVQKCAIDNLHKDLYFLDPAKPITTEEFISRHDRLAKALAASDLDAFVLEPGYTFQ